MFLGCSPCCGPKEYCDTDKGLVSGLRVAGTTNYQSDERQYEAGTPGTATYREWTHQSVNMLIPFNAFFPATFSYSEQVFDGGSVTFADPNFAVVGQWRYYTLQWKLAISAPTDTTVLRRPSIRFRGFWDLVANYGGIYGADWASIHFQWDPCYGNRFTDDPGWFWVQRQHAASSDRTRLLGFFWAFGKQLEIGTATQYTLQPAAIDCDNPGFPLGTSSSYIRSGVTISPFTGYTLSGYTGTGYSSSFEVQLDTCEFVMADGTTIPYFECEFTDW